MFKSSINTINFRPSGGPYTSFVRFSMQSSIALCTSRELVLELKFIVIYDMLLSLPVISASTFSIVTVFAVPHAPTNKIGLFEVLHNVFNSQEDLTVSAVRIS